MKKIMTAKEKLSAYNRQWRLKHPLTKQQKEAQKKYAAKWRVENAEHRAEYMKRYRREHRETILANEKRYYLKKKAEREASRPLRGRDVVPIDAK